MHQWHGSTHHAVDRHELISTLQVAVSVRDSTRYDTWYVDRWILFLATHHIEPKTLGCLRQLDDPWVGVTLACSKRSNCCLTVVHKHACKHTATLILSCQCFVFCILFSLCLQCPDSQSTSHLWCYKSCNLVLIILVKCSVYGIVSSLGKTTVLKIYISGIRDVIDKTEGSFRTFVAFNKTFQNYQVIIVKQFLLIQIFTAITHIMTFVIQIFNWTGRKQNSNYYNLD